jgi:hypothetical protein
MMELQMRAYPLQAGSVPTPVVAPPRLRMALAAIAIDGMDRMIGQDALLAEIETAIRRIDAVLAEIEPNTDPDVWKRRALLLAARTALLAWRRALVAVLALPEPPSDATEVDPVEQVHALVLAAHAPPG